MLFPESTGAVFSGWGYTKERLQGIDGVGGILSISWPIPLLFALQEAGVHYEWRSGVIIGTIITGGVLFLIFGFYEAWISAKTKLDAIFPIRFLTNPCMALTLLSMFLLGFPFYVMFIQLPQRFQGVNFTSAERAGILLLPVTLLTPVGAIIAGALNMMRTLGGAVAVAICSALHHNLLDDQLPTVLSPQQAAAVEESSVFINMLPEETREQLGRVFGKSYNRQFQVMIACALLNFLVAIALAVVRKRRGIFGTIPVRKEGNEFTKTVPKEGETHDPRHVGIAPAPREKALFDAHRPPQMLSASTPSVIEEIKPKHT